MQFLSFLEVRLCLALSIGTAVFDFSFQGTEQCSLRFHLLSQGLKTQGSTVFLTSGVAPILSSPFVVNLGTQNKEDEDGGAPIQLPEVRRQKK